MGGIGNLLGGIFLPDEENLTSSDLDDLFLSGGGRDKNLVGEGVFFYEEIFLGGGTLPHSLQWEKTCIYIYMLDIYIYILYIYIYIYYIYIYIIYIYIIFIYIYIYICIVCHHEITQAMRFADKFLAFLHQHKFTKVKI